MGLSLLPLSTVLLSSHMPMVDMDLDLELSTPSPPWPSRPSHTRLLLSRLLMPPPQLMPSLLSWRRPNTATTSSSPAQSSMSTPLLLPPMPDILMLVHMVPVSMVPVSMVPVSMVDLLDILMDSTVSPLLLLLLLRSPLWPKSNLSFQFQLDRHCHPLKTRLC